MEVSLLQDNLVLHQVVPLAHQVVPLAHQEVHLDQGKDLVHPGQQEDPVQVPPVVRPETDEAV